MYEQPDNKDCLGVGGGMKRSLSDFIKVAPIRLCFRDAMEDINITRCSYDDAQKLSLQSKTDIESFQEYGKYMVRLLGRIVELEMDPGSTDSIITCNSKQTKVHFFWIEDGTSKIKVQLDLSTVDKLSLLKLKIGDLVDCVGFLVSAQNHQQVGTSDADGMTWLYANSISQHDKNNSSSIEQLRQSEIMCERSSNTNTPVATPDFPFINNMLAPGLPHFETKNMFSFSTHHHQENENSGQSSIQTEVAVNSDHLMHLIKCFASQTDDEEGPPSGISENDLALLMNITGQVDTRFGDKKIYSIHNNYSACDDESRNIQQKLRDALKVGLEDLQANGQIYMGPNDCYLPL